MKPNRSNKNKKQVMKQLPKNANNIHIVQEIKHYFVIRYLCRVTCNQLIHKYPYHACMQANNCYSANKYYYQCFHCKSSHCITHMLCHYALFKSAKVHYFNGNKAMIIDPLTTTKEGIKISLYLSQYAESISVGSKVYITGGFNPLLDNVYEYRTKKNTLIEKHRMMHQKCRHALCSLFKTIYSIGGYNGSESLSSCEIYDIQADKWTPLPSLNTPRSQCAVFVWGDAIFAFGGDNNYAFTSHNLNSMESLKLRSQKWLFISVINPPTARKSIQGCNVANEVVIFGGFEYKNVVKYVANLE